jgi:hypothetical protein
MCGVGAYAVILEVPVLFSSRQYHSRNVHRSADDHQLISKPPLDLWNVPSKLHLSNSLPLRSPITKSKGVPRAGDVSEIGYLLPFNRVSCKGGVFENAISDRR